MFATNLVDIRFAESFLTSVTLNETLINCFLLICLLECVLSAKIIVWNNTLGSFQ